MTQEVTVKCYRSEEAELMAGCAEDKAHLHSS